MRLLAMPASGGHAQPVFFEIVAREFARRNDMGFLAAGSSFREVLAAAAAMMWDEALILGPKVLLAGSGMPATGLCEEQFGAPELCSLSREQLPDLIDALRRRVHPSTAGFDEFDPRDFSYAFEQMMPTSFISFSQGEDTGRDIEKWMSTWGRNLFTNSPPPDEDTVVIPVFTTGESRSENLRMLVRGIAQNWSGSTPLVFVGSFRPIRFGVHTHHVQTNDFHGVLEFMAGRKGRSYLFSPSCIPLLPCSPVTIASPRLWRRLDTIRETLRKDGSNPDSQALYQLLCHFDGGETSQPPPGFPLIVDPAIAAEALESGLAFTEQSFAVFHHRTAGASFSTSRDVLLRDGSAVNHGIPEGRFNFACRIPRPDSLLRRYLVNLFRNPCCHEYTVAGH